MISVIIPVYKVENYIERCVRSVMSQTYKNVEIILIDDCGQDTSMAIAETILRDAIGIQYRIEYHRENAGLSAARNTGLRVAKGKYIYFLDSDDWIPENALLCLVEAAEKYTSACVVGEYSDCVDVTGEILSIPYKYNKEIFFSTQTDLITFFADKNLPVTAWNKLIRRDVLLTHNLFFEQGIYHEDCLWTFQLMIVLPSLVLVPIVSYCYSINPGSIMNRLNDDKMKQRIYSYIVVLNKMCEAVGPLQNVLNQRKLVVYIDETKKYMYRRLLADGVLLRDLKCFYKKTHRLMKFKDWCNLSVKLKIAHADQLLPSRLGYYYLLFLCNCLYKK